MDLENPIAVAISVDGSYAFVIADDAPDPFLAGKLYVFNITNPADPQLVACVDIEEGVSDPLGHSHVSDIAVLENTAYITGRFVDEGNEVHHCLQRFDISDLENPVFVSSSFYFYWGLPPPEEGRAIAAAGSYTYMTASWGLEVLGTGGGIESYGMHGVAVGEDFVSLTHADEGLLIAYKQCEAVAIDDDPELTDPDDDLPILGSHLSVYPNPFNPQTTITFSLERDEWAAVGVYELTGRRVALLTDRTFDAGTHSLTWSGRDETGRAMPSGAYLVRLETESSVEARKVMLLR